MYSFINGEVGVFDFHEFANHLLDQGIQASPSELHGCLSGMLGAGASREAEVALAALPQLMDLMPHGELAEQTMQLYRVTASSLEDEEFDFHPLLPDEEDDISERTEALSLWCKGFLAGFAHVTAGMGGAPALPPDSSEILADFAQIAQATVDDEASEDELESSYIELVEYLRFAALNVAMDSLNAVRKEGEGS